MRLSFALLTILFFMWGFITVMNDVLINTFRSIFNLSNFQSGLVQFSFFGAFFVVSLLYYVISSRSGDPINRLGYKNGMSLGLLITGMGCVLFYPAGLNHSYTYFLMALFVLATGVTILQIAANPYASIMGNPESAASRLNLAQGLNSLGTTIGPIMGAILIYSIFSDGERSPESVGKTYLLYGLIFFLLAFITRISKMPSFKNDETAEMGFAVLKFKNLRFGIGAIFFYVGAEVAIGSWMVQYVIDPNVLGIAEVDANKYLAFYWGGLMIGRLTGALSLSKGRSEGFKKRVMPFIGLTAFLFIYLATGIKEDNGEFYFNFIEFKKVILFLAFLFLNYLGFIFGTNSSGKVLSLFAFVNIILIVLSISTSGNIAFWSMISTGLFNSIMWSNIFTISIKDLGKYTSQGSSLLIMAIVGGAIIPPLQGWLSDQESIGIRYSFLLPILAYIYIVFFGWMHRKVSV